MLEEGVATSNNPMPALKNPAYLARVANRYRQKRRPNEPCDQFRVERRTHTR